MLSVNTPKLAMALILSIMTCAVTIGLPIFVQSASAAPSYRVTAFPYYSQEGSTITIVLSVMGAQAGITYEFQFQVRDPSSQVRTSNGQKYTPLPGEFEFFIVIFYPGPEFPGGSKTDLVGVYLVNVVQVNPLTINPNVAQTYFLVGLTNNTKYQRTETVSIQASDYSPGESVGIDIRTASSLTLVYSNTVFADPSGLVIDSWKIPKDATTAESYIVTVTGTVTSKNPADAQGFDVEPATVSILALSTASSYQRTETMSFSFQAFYPSGDPVDSGLALVTLTRPDMANRTLTATYDGEGHWFRATYKTTPFNQTGTWTGSLQGYSFDDGFGNIGPVTTLSNSTQLNAATLSVSIQTKTVFAAFEQIAFNATIRYPDSSNLQAGNVNATLVYSGGGYSVSIPVIFDTALQLWFGSYTPAANAPSGYWSLIVGASDSALPANSGLSMRAIQIQNRPPIATFTSSTSTALTGISITYDAGGSSDSDGSIVSYLWNFGDGSTGSGVLVGHSFNSAGSFTVVLTITDNGGATATSSSTANIQNRPPTALLTGPTGNGVAGASISFDGTGSSDPDGQITNYLWDFGDSTTGTGPTTSHTYTTPGTYTVRLTVTDSNGSTASTTFDINVGPATGGSTSSFPTYFWAILVAALAAAVVGAFFAFKRHKVTHTKLKIDLEAVRTEAGRIENQEFFQSVKEQLKKDKDND